MKDEGNATLQAENLERVRGKTTFDDTAAFSALEAAFLKALEKNSSVLNNGPLKKVD